MIIIDITIVAVVVFITIIIIIYTHKLDVGATLYARQRQKF